MLGQKDILILESINYFEEQEKLQKKLKSESDLLYINSKINELEEILKDKTLDEATEINYLLELTDLYSEKERIERYE